MTASDPIILSSTANPTVKRLSRLRDNRERRRNERVIVDGWRETARAIESGLELCGVYVPASAPAPADSDDSSWRQLVMDQANERGLLVQVSSSVMQKIGFGQSPRGVVAEFVQPAKPLQGLRLPAVPLLLVLDQIEKPGNLGAVFRTADACGVDAVIITGDGCDLFNPNAIRASLGAVFTVPAAAATESDAKEFLVARDIRPLAARVQASKQLWSSDLTGPLAIVLGSETAGLGDRWQEIAGQRIEGVCVPMLGTIDSLNISVSAAVIAFEAARVRKRRADIDANGH